MSAKVDGVLYPAFLWQIRLWCVQVQLDASAKDYLDLDPKFHFRGILRGATYWIPT